MNAPNDNQKDLLVDGIIDLAKTDPDSAIKIVNSLGTDEAPCLCNENTPPFMDCYSRNCRRN